jgi:hypothetical protein
MAPTAQADAAFSPERSPLLADEAIQDAALAARHSQPSGSIPMSYRVRQHSDIRGRDATVFTMRSPGGDVVTISAPADKRKCQYSSTTAPSGYGISRWHAAEIIQALRRKGWEVNAVRYVYVNPHSNQYGGGY